MKKKFTQINLRMYRILFLSIFTLSGLLATAQSSREYTVAEVADFITDLPAGTYDTLILSTSGGVYDIDYIRINNTTVIMGKEGLEAKPILKNTVTTSTSSAILSVRDAGVRDTISLINLEFDGSNSNGGKPGVIRSLADHHFIVKDCYIHDILNSGGVFRMDGAGASIDMQNTLVANCYRRVIGFSKQVLYGDANITNCTFAGITGGYVIHFASSGGVYAQGNNVDVDHCTFYDIGAATTYYHTDSIYGTFSMTNSIFDQVTGTLKSDIVDYNYVAGIETPPANATNSITTAPQFANAALLNFALLNSGDLTGSDLQILGDLSWYDDTFAPIVLEELIKIDQTHVMVQFNELVDVTTATTATNYTLSGTGGFTGNPSEAVLDANGKDVVLTVPDLSGMDIGQTVIVTVANVEDLVGNVVEAGSDVATYTLMDEIPPLVTMAAQSVTNDAGQSAAAQSNEIGKIYLIHADAPQVTVEDFQDAVVNRLGAVADVATVDVDVQISVAALKVGNYSAYAVDTSMNISVKSTNEVVVTDITAPEVSMLTQEVTNSKIDVVIAQSNEVGMIYLILDGEPQSTIADFEAAIAAGKGSSAPSVTANQDVTVSAYLLEPGTYYSYAVDEVENISTKSTSAAVVSKFVPRVRYYTAAEALQMEEDIKNSLDGDVFILTESGGDYKLYNRLEINAKITIMADEGLEEKPVIWTDRQTGYPQVVLLKGGDRGLTLKGIRLKANPDPAWPTTYLIRADVGNYYLVAEDCYFNAIGLKGGGALFRNYAGSHMDSIIFRNCIFEGGEEGLSSKSYVAGFDKIEVTNCTFFDMTEQVLLMKHDPALNGHATIDVNHCTFNNVGGVDRKIFELDNFTQVAVMNSILANTTADTVWHMYGDATNKSTMDYTNLHNAPAPLDDQGGVLGSNMFALDPMFADTATGDFTLGNTTLLDLGSDGLPLGDLRWADIFGPKVQATMTARSDSTILLKYDEWIDTASAEVAANYTLSGSAGFTGNVKKAELFNFYSVLLTLENFSNQVGNDIVVTVANVEDLKGNVVDPAHNTSVYTVEEFKPVVTANMQTVTNGDGQVVIAQSNQGAGFVYVILDGEPQSTIAELDAAVDALKGAKVVVTEAYADMEIVVYGVLPGEYYAYATDVSGNLSDKGLNLITITDGIPPVVTAEVQSATNAADQVVAVQSNELGTVYIILDGEVQETENDFISAVFDGKGSSEEVVAVDTDVNVSTKDLFVGIYYAYAVDTSGNISLKGTNPLNITEAASSLETLDELQVKVYAYGSNIVIESLPSEMDMAVVFDLTGRIVANQKIDSNRHEIQIDRQGVYFVKLSSVNNDVKSFKLIIQ